MNPSTRDDMFDARAQGLHAQALREVPPRTLRDLHVRRGATTRARPASRALAWPMAGACAALLAVVALVPQPEGALPVPGGAPEPIASGQPPAGSDADAYAALDEDPDLYLWLASRDAQPLAME